MPYQTDNYIHLPNPDHPESDFRKNNKGDLNIVGTTNFGGGIQGRMGLLLGSGKTAVAVYLFSKPKFTMETAREWLKNHKSKENGMMEIKKDFNFIMPLKKSYEGNDGFYYLEYALSTTSPDLENDQMTEACIDDMIKQAPLLNSFMSHDPNRIIGPITKSWKENGEMWVQVRVKPSMRKDIEEDINTGVRYGGSMGGNLIKAYMEGDIRKIEKVHLMEGSLTPLPMNWGTSGTARGFAKSMKCPNNICTQILKSIDMHIDKGGNPMPNTELIKDISEQLSKVNMEIKAITMLPGYPEDLDDYVKQDQAQLMSLMGSLVTTLVQLVGDMIDDEIMELAQFYGATEA